MISRQVPLLDLRAQYRQIRAEVLADSELQRQLRETKDKEGFLEMVIQLGHERGYNFSMSDVESALNEARRTWLERWIQ